MRSACVVEYSRLPPGFVALRRAGWHSEPVFLAKLRELPVYYSQIVLSVLAARAKVQEVQEVRHEHVRVERGRLETG